jgi:hypothetical protein
MKDKSLKEVRIKRDNHGHYYVIPVELGKDFESDLDKANATDEYQYFIEKYGEYMRRGHISQITLYAEL